MLTNAAIVARGSRKTFGEVRALEELDLTVAEASVTQ